MAYLEDSDRFQIRMGSLEEEKDNPVRFVDVFVEQLDLSKSDLQSWKSKLKVASLSIPKCS